MNGKRPRELQPTRLDDGVRLRPAVVGALLIVLACGGVFPLATTGLARVLFPRQALGSLVVRDGRVVGSELVARPLDGPEWFQGRPSAIDSSVRAAAGSNLAPDSRALRERAAAAGAAAARRENVPLAALPPDLITESASGVDPHVSPEAALIQVSRVARARGLAPSAVRELVLARVEGPTLGVLGQPRVNVLLLNLALEEQTPLPSKVPR